MKAKNLFLIILFLVPVSVCSQISNEFSITGHINGVKDGDIVMLHKVEGRIGRLFMQDTLQNGRFTFKERSILLRKFE